MSGFLFLLAGLGAVAVIGTLLLGLFVMARGGDTDRKYSNRLMRARVMLQGATVAAFLLALLSAKK